MTESPWINREPQPGDFDIDIATIDPRFVELHRGTPTAKLRIVLTIEGQDAERLERLAAARGEKPAAVVAGLLRDAERPAA
jgi:hypothetical protein